MIEAIGVAAAPAVEAHARMLDVSLPEPVLAAGLTVAPQVAWVRVREAERRPAVRPRALARERLHPRGAGGGPVALLASRRVSSDVARAPEQRDQVRAAATAWLGTARRAGDPPGAAAKIGTNDLVASASAPPSDEALLEAGAVAATGTGTGCTARTCPPSRGPRELRAGAAAHEVVAECIRRCLEETAAVSGPPLVGGGVRPGKSAARRPGMERVERRACGATARALVEEMRARIALHVRERAGAFVTAEPPALRDPLAGLRPAAARTHAYAFEPDARRRPGSLCRERSG